MYIDCIILAKINEMGCKHLVNIQQVVLNINFVTFIL